MGGIINLHEMVHVDVGIPLGCGKVLVPEHFLNGPEIGSRVEQVRGESVPEPMRAQLLPKAARDKFGLQERQPNERSVCRRAHF